MKKGKNNETLAKASKKNSNEVCPTEEELESAAGGYKIITTCHSESNGSGELPREWTDYTVEGRTLGIGPKKSKTFATKKEAEKWASKNLFF